MSHVALTSDALSATIALHGAELQSLHDAEGRELMSSGDPAFWSGRAPILFPFVGRLHDDVYRIGGRVYAMPKHGFARQSTFAVVDRSADAVTLRLTDTDASRAAYPFAFELDARFALVGSTLEMCCTIRNIGSDAMPASFGYHPAFAWPLPGFAKGDAHRIAFERDEPGRLSGVTSYGTIAEATASSPVRGRTLALTDELFVHDALVWKDLRSRRLSYGAPGATQLDIAFPDTSWLGIWTKPGAAFVCIEPWSGCADPEGYTGDVFAKPGVIAIPPQEERAFRMTVSVRIR